MIGQRRPLGPVVGARPRDWASTEEQQLLAYREAWRHVRSCSRCSHRAASWRRSGTRAKSACARRSSRPSHRSAPRTEATLENEWLTVKTGMMGGEHLVPYSCVAEDGEAIAVPFDKDQIKSAPIVDKGHASPAPSERAEVFAHFGMEDPGPPSRI